MMVGPIEDDRRSLQDTEPQQRRMQQLQQREGGEAPHVSATRSGQSTDDSTSNPPCSTRNYQRSKVTSSSDDYVHQPMTGRGYDRTGTLPRSFRSSTGRAPLQERRREDSEERESVRSGRRTRSNSVKSGRLSSYEESDGVVLSGNNRDGDGDNSRR